MVTKSDAKLAIGNAEHSRSVLRNKEGIASHPKNDQLAGQSLLEVIEDADLALVELKPASNGQLYPYCRLHGAMAKITPEGIWRCVSTYMIFTDPNGNKRLRENACRAGCFYPKRRRDLQSESNGWKKA